jgi:sugar/nucleoside kinase (ribokinase family)
MKPYDAVVAGYTGIDLAPGFPRSLRPAPLGELLRPGKLLQTEGLSLALGGVVPNTGLALQRFGQRVSLQGLVGYDALGDQVLRLLRAHRAEGGIRRTRRAGTAYGIVLAPPGTDRMFLEDPGCNGIFTSRDVDYATVAKARLFHFGYPTLMAAMFANNGLELQKMFARAHRHGVATSLDLTLPDPDSPAGRVNWRRLLAAVLPQVDVFVPSVEEILGMLAPDVYTRLVARACGGDVIDAVPRELYRSLGDQLIGMGAKVLLIKAGHKGAYLRTGDVSTLVASRLRLPAGWGGREIWADPLPVDRQRFRNSCGAGDCAVAGFLAAMLEGMSPWQAGRMAMRAGRDNLYGVDALSGLASWKEIRKPS